MKLPGPTTIRVSPPLQASNLGDNDHARTSMDEEQRDRSFHFTPLMYIMNIQSPKPFHFDVTGEHWKFIELAFLHLSMSRFISDRGAPESQPASLTSSGKWASASLRRRRAIASSGTEIWKWLSEDMMVGARVGSFSYLTFYSKPWVGFFRAGRSLRFE